MMTTTQKPAPLQPLTNEELAARRRQGRPHPGLVEEPFGMRELERALEAEHKEAGEPLVEPPAAVEREMFGVDSLTRQVSWKSRIFGSFTVLSEIGLGDPISLDQFTMAVPVLLTGYPDAIEFSLKRELATGVRLYRAENGPPVQCTTGELAKFSVPVEWRKNPRPQGPRRIPNLIPKTRDMDLVFLDTLGNGDGRKGAFIQVEVQLCTRRGSFFLVFQQVYAGQIVRTTTTHAEKLGLQSVQEGTSVGSAIPLSPQSAYPGSDPFKNFGYLMPAFVRSAIECGASVPLSQCTIARWEPARKPLPEYLGLEDGWRTATVMWFNPVVGYGFLYDDEDGGSCFVHFKQIEEMEGKTFPHLTPMRTVAVRYEETKQAGEGRKAAAVRAL